MNQTDGIIACQACCGSTLNFLCCPVCVACGCNKFSVSEGEAGIISRQGRFVKSIGPGTYMTNSCAYEYKTIQLHNRIASSNGITLLTSDNVTVSIGFFVGYQIIDPFCGSFGVYQLDSAIIMIASAKLKEVVSMNTFQSLLRMSQDINDIMKESLLNDLKSVGLEITSCAISRINISKQLMLSMAQAAIAEKDSQSKKMLAQADLDASKFTTEAAQILKQNSSSMDLHFFQTIEHIAKGWNQVVIAADGMLYVPDTHDSRGGIAHQGSRKKTKQEPVYEEEQEMSDKPQIKKKKR